LKITINYNLFSGICAGDRNSRAITKIERTHLENINKWSEYNTAVSVSFRNTILIDDKVNVSRLNSG
jgi:hypothetical protein